jgi:hypothetical protein
VHEALMSDYSVDSTVCVIFANRLMLCQSRSTRPAMLHRYYRCKYCFEQILYVITFSKYETTRMCSDSCVYTAHAQRQGCLFRQYAYLSQWIHTLHGAHSRCGCTCIWPMACVYFVSFPIAHYLPNSVLLNLSYSFVCAVKARQYFSKSKLSFKVSFFQERL